MDFNLNKFDPKQIPAGSKCVFIGKSQTGKTVLLIDILYNKRDSLESVCCISATKDGREDFKDIIPPLYTHSEMSTDLLRKFLGAVDLKIKTYMEAGLSKDEIKARGSCIIIDDALYDNKPFKTKEMKYIFMNARHDFILTMISMQYPIGIDPQLRTNIDYIFILKEAYLNNRKKIYENYASMFPSFEIFCAVMDECTNNYECIVINNKAITNSINDQVFWYKAKVHKKFKVGCKEYRKFGRRNLKKEDEMDNPFSIARDLYKKYQGSNRIYITKK